MQADRIVQRHEAVRNRGGLFCYFCGWFADRFHVSSSAWR